MGISMRHLIAGNWKMNGLSASLSEVEAVAAAVAGSPPGVDVMICPPATLVARAAGVAASRIAIGGQDCHAEPSGAFTGETSAEMLKDAGASAVIVGHSERRQYSGETDAQVAAKAKAAWRGGLLAIICVGESEADRDADRALEVVRRQIAHSIPAGAIATSTAVAYEPVWAIGTGRTPTIRDISDMHADIRRQLVSRLGDTGRVVRILYGGSVKPGNAREILATAEVGGALVGGASLKAAEFLAIVAAAAPKV
ncbi:MAG: triose-phosphate isomerase [Rhizomicrobium sp.]|jgi:triosephosphate isomerase